jgi:beta-lactamase superfamily II metal-dependent hydrolase
MRLLFAVLLLTASPIWAAKNLEMYFIDVEGGQATLIVSPSGESLLVDTGWLGYGQRDAKRIADAAKAAKVKRIDYVLITHYHLDHVGGALALTEQIPVGTFVDHGPNTETGKRAGELDEVYRQALANTRHLVVKPGDTIPVKGLDIRVVAANGDHVDAPLARGGDANARCDGAEQKKPDPSENARSVGFLLTFGSFRFINLGDLTWNKELELACPKNLIGPVDIYLTTHHGLDQSNPPELVHALGPQVAIMNNGAKKGGSPSAWKAIRSSPGLEDIWQLHFAIAGAKETNARDTFIANLEEQCAGNYLRVSVLPDGSYTVFNSRNKYSKTYKPRTSS